jgi:predicted nucleotidyltransferase
MAKIELHPDFKDFLKLLNSHKVKYLLVGGYAVGYYGYPRATGDMDIWIEISESNAEKLEKVFCDFQMSQEAISKDLFLKKETIIRMGIPPVRLEVITNASGVDFSACYSKREIVDIDGIPANFISLPDLKTNKKAAGRHKDLDDLSHLP